MTHRERAEAINRAEWEAERADLMRRAFAYAEQKRMAERARALGVNVTDQLNTKARTPRRSGREPTRMTHAGRSLTVREWAALTGLTPSALYARLKAGWTIEQTLCLPTAEQRREGIIATAAANLDYDLGHDRGGCLRIVRGSWGPARGAPRERRRI